MTEPTRPVPVHDPTVPVRVPEPFTRGWRGPQAPGHPGSQLVVRPVAVPPPYVGYPPPRETSTPAVVAFVFGCLGVLGVAPLSAVGLVLNITSWRETSSGRKEGHGLQIAGLVLNVLGVLLLVGVVVALVVYLGFVAALIGVFGASG